MRAIWLSSASFDTASSFDMLGGRTVPKNPNGTLRGAAEPASGSAISTSSAAVVRARRIVGRRLKARKVSTRPLAPQDDEKRTYQDLHVLAQAVVLDVLALDGQALLEVELAASVDLHGARDPGPHLEAKALRLPVALHQPDLLGARADEAHVAPEDVEQLRELVEARASQEAPDARDARIVAQLVHRLGAARRPRSPRRFAARRPRTSS